MIVSEAFRGKRFAVLGLARSGIATVGALLASGAEVVAWDADEGARNAVLALLPSPSGGRVGVGGCGPTDAHVAASTPPPTQPSPRRGEGFARPLSLADPLTIDLAGFDGVIVSPGVPLNRHPIAPYAAAAGVPVIGDVELFAQARGSLPAHKVVGITGPTGSRRRPRSSPTC
jgi:UDP-N-acetylmuramoylalanine--D-glutamate ligase